MIDVSIQIKIYVDGLTFAARQERAALWRPLDIGPCIGRTIFLQDILVHTTECERESLILGNIETDELVKGKFSPLYIRILHQSTPYIGKKLKVQ